MSDTFERVSETSSSSIAQQLRSARPGPGDPRDGARVRRGTGLARAGAPRGAGLLGGVRRARLRRPGGALVPALVARVEVVLGAAGAFAALIKRAVRHCSCVFSGLSTSNSTTDLRRPHHWCAKNECSPFEYSVHRDKQSCVSEGVRMPSGDCVSRGTGRTGTARPRRRGTATSGPSSASWTGSQPSRPNARSRSSPAVAACSLRVLGDG